MKIKKIINKHVDNIDRIIKKFGLTAGILITVWTTASSLSISLFLFKIGWRYMGVLGVLTQTTFGIILQYVFVKKISEEFCK